MGTSEYKLSMLWEPLNLNYQCYGNLYIYIVNVMETSESVILMFWEPLNLNYQCYGNH